MENGRTLCDYNAVPHKFDTCRQIAPSAAPDEFQDKEQQRPALGKKVEDDCMLSDHMHTVTAHIDTHTRSTRADADIVFVEVWAEWQTNLQAWKQAQQDWIASCRNKHKPTIKAEVLNVSSVAEVTDVGSGEPLFSKFYFEGLALLSIRFDLHLLMLTCPTLPQSHLVSYYYHYLQKHFTISSYGFQEFSELAGILNDTVRVKGEQDFLEPQLSAGTQFEHFVELTEAHRRDRLRRVNTGDLAALLKFHSQPPLHIERSTAQP